MRRDTAFLLFAVACRAPEARNEKLEAARETPKQDAPKPQLTEPPNVPLHERAPILPRLLPGEGDLQRVEVERDAVEEVLALDGGFAWTEDGKVWRYVFGDAKPERLARFCDPHALATHGSDLAWLGCETNAIHDLVTGETRPVPVVGPPPLAKGLTFVGKTLVTANDTGLLWRYVDGVPEKIYMHVPGPWMWSTRGLAAGGDFLFAAARDGAGRELLGRVVLQPRPALTPLDLGRVKSQSAWVANEGGDVLFIDAKGAAVWVVPHDATKARRVVASESVDAACWCGPDICTLAGDMLRRHGRRRANVELQIPGVEEAASHSCGFGRLVIEHDRNMISSILLPERPR